MVSAKEFRAAEARRILEDVDPYLIEIERDEIEAAVGAKWHTPEGEAEAKRHLECVNVIRLLKGRLEIAILQGKPKG
jgi:hypothetical protein